MNGGEPKKRFFLNHKKSSALLISVIIHVVFIVVAVTFVAVNVYIKPEQTFAVVDVNRPKMKLQKLQVPVKQQKKAQAPKLRKMIVTRKKTTVDIQMPEIVGIKGGTGYGQGGGLGGLGFGFDMDLFGGSGGSGNELVGTLYDLKLTARGKGVDMDTPKFFDEVGNFCGSWSTGILDDYFQAPKKKYGTAFFFPQIDAAAAPEAFGVADIVKPTYWVVHYEGKMAAPETGDYRFRGYGDDILIVRVGKREVLQANWDNRKAISWTSDDPEDQKYKIFRTRPLFVGDWFPLKKGQSVPIEILLGECAGGKFACALMIEQKGVQYKKSPAGKPILPLFKTQDVMPQVLGKMRIDPNDATAEGPVFGVLTNTE